ncbi:MAG TPA: hypothetical protein DEO65_15070 [Bacillus bacterium]|uniref:Uncharacterized protein n=1 Tax=Siminovitchia fordii TaxID=254759 RepID=A0ABQ4K525_9BACI|nr:hypothetical protein [Siminovitchia fordii]GIN20832.1 hypothetical protein J1TS3_19660 [Siminovitchia fordii]HBZ11164.1 hypothetical protein [Bacillus sp. (in: firmicutes)]
MSAFIGLLKKDLSLMKFWYVVWLTFLFLGMIGVYALSVYTSEPSITVPFLVTMAGFHVFLAPLSVLTVLNIEGKTQLWLYNPQGSIKLLLSKISAAALVQLLAQFFISLYALFVMKVLMNEGVIDSFNNFLPWKQGFLMQLGIFGVSMYISIWVIFLWAVYHSLGKYPAIKNFRWLVVILVWVSYNLLEVLLAKTKLIQNMVFSFGVNINIAPKMDYGTNNSWNIIYTDANIPIMTILLYILLSVIFFFLSSWLLDRKVEV